MLLRYDPFREFDRLAEQTFGTARTALPLDAFRHGDEFVINVDLPGVDPSAIDITVERNVMTLKAERAWRRSEEDQVLMSERPQGTFTRQLYLGEGLDADRVNARYEHGVLTLTIPVAEKAKPRKVEVAGVDSGPKAVEANSTEHAA
jgi:HSP20 family protein